MVTALCLFSGSLASRVAARLVERFPGVDKVALFHFRSPFFEECDRLRELVKEEWPGVSFRTQSLKKDYRRLANIPAGHHFSLTRSCLSCRTLMLSRAIRYMERIKADFLVTGEILDRHGLSDVEMERITEDLGVGGLVLRPLSAQALPPSRPEIEGWVDRDSLFGLHEEDRERLVDLARELGLDVEDQVDSPTRCKLAIPGFGARLENLFEEEGFTLNAVKLLEFGVYYKYPPDVKIVLALDEKEKRALQTFFLPQDLRVYIPTHQGPLALVRTDWARKSPVQVEEIVALAARITVTYSDAANMRSVPVKYRFEKENETSILKILPFPSIAEIEQHCFACDLSAPLRENKVPLP